eukprot:g2268.t1
MKKSLWKKAKSAATEIRAESGDVNALKQVGYQHLIDGNREKAVEILEQAVAYGLDDKVAWRRLGEVSMELYEETQKRDYLDKAYYSYEAAVKSWENLSNPKVRAALGNVYKEYGSYEGALEVFSGIITDFPRYEEINLVTFRSACILVHIEEFKQASAYVEYVLDDPPEPFANGMSILFMLARVYELDDRIREANDAYQRIFRTMKKMKKHDDAKSWRQWLGMSAPWKRFTKMFFEQKNFIMAANVASRALQNENAHEWDEELWAMLAKSYNRINEFDNAANAAEAALALDPYNPMTRSLILELNPDKWWYHLNEQDEAALLLERCFRGMKGRWKAYERRQYVIMLGEKALDIQRVYRGHRGRLLAKDWIHLNERATDIERVFRGMLGRKAAAKWAYELYSIIKVQAVYRGSVARRFVAQIPHRAATDINRMARGYMDRKYVKELREAIAASIVIERVYRGHLGRLIAKRERFRLRCAIKVQCKYRQFKAKQEMLARRRFLQSVLKIQARFRGQDARGIVRRLKYFYATQITKIIRGHLGRIHVANRKVYKRTRSNDASISNRMAHVALTTDCAFISSGDEEFSLNPDYFMQRTSNPALIVDNDVMTPEISKLMSRSLHSNDILKCALLGKGNMGDYGLQSFALSLRTNSTLKTLGVSSNNVSEKGARVLAETLRKSNFRLQTLIIEDNENIGEVGGLHLAQAIGDFFFGRFGHMTSFSLSSCKLTDKVGVAFGEGLCINRRLISLHLDNNFIKDAGAVAIGKALIRNSSLELLDLRNNEIGDEGAASILQALELQNTTLLTLYLEENLIIDTGGKVSALACSMLKKNLTIEKFSLEGNMFHRFRLDEINRIMEERNNSKLSALQNQPWLRGEELRKQAAQIRIKNAFASEMEMKKKDEEEAAAAIIAARESDKLKKQPFYNSKNVSTSAAIKKLTKLEENLFKKTKALKYRLNKLGTALEKRAQRALVEDGTGRPLMRIGNRYTQYSSFLGPVNRNDTLGRSPYADANDKVLGLKISKVAQPAKYLAPLKKNYQQLSSKLTTSEWYDEALPSIPHVKTHQRNNMSSVKHLPKLRIPTLKSQLVPEFGGIGM